MADVIRFWEIHLHARTHERTHARTHARKHARTNAREQARKYVSVDMKHSQQCAIAAS